MTKPIRNFDWKLLIAVFLLSLMGLAAIYSVDLSRGSSLTYFRKQLVSLGLGVAIFVWASLRQHTFWRYLAKWWYLLSLILLVLVLAIGSAIRGTRGWFSAFGFSFQPSELAKVGLILMMAYIISRFGRRYERPLFFFGTAVVAFVPMVLVLVQPALGSAFLLGLIWLAMVWAVGARRLFLALLIIAMVVGSVGAWTFVLKDFQKERISTFLDPARDPLKSGYNINQSIIAVGAGKWFGRGLGYGSQSQLRFLPEAQTDFIFSVIAEELGFAGVLAMLVIYAVFFWRLLVLIKESRDDFSGALGIGILVLFFGQFFINVSANIGLLPIAGVTLPFISYGGSSLIINFLLIGILESQIKAQQTGLSQIAE